MKNSTPGEAMRRRPPKPPPSGDYQWRFYLLGHSAYFVPRTKRLLFFGPRAGMAWVLACRLAKLLGGTIAENQNVWFKEPWPSDYIAKRPGLEPLPIELGGVLALRRGKGPA